MSNIILCDISSDCLSKIDIGTFNIKKLNLKNINRPYGPHELIVYKNKILTANINNNSISIIDLDQFYEEDNIYVGSHPNDISIYNNNAYVLCGDSNSLIVYDIFKRLPKYQIKTGEMPHSIKIMENGIGFVTNMYNNTISIIDCKENVIIKDIIVGENPIKVKLSNNNKYLYVCVGCMECDNNGYIGIIDVNNFKMLVQVKVGRVPVDLFEDDNFLYVSNFYDGSISVINLLDIKQERKLKVGGMPRGIVKNRDNIFICDYLNGVLKIVNEKEQKIKAIPIGKEPNAMTFIKDSTDKL